MNIIPKFQQGGGFDSIFTTYTAISPQPSARRQSLSKNASKNSEGPDLDKIVEKMLDMFKDVEGLPNEIQALSNNLANTLYMAYTTGSSDLGSLISTYAKGMAKLNTAKYNKELFDNTYQWAVSKDNLNEIAITDRGSILTLNENNEIKEFTPQEWVKVRDSAEYIPLTNSNLLWMRSHMPSYINNNNILQVVENGISLDQTHKMVKDRFEKLGTKEFTTEQFISKEAIKGQKLIEQMLEYGPEGYYKLKSTSSAADQNAVEAALAYIYSTLPSNAKTRLALETKDGSQTSVKSLIGALIFGTLESKTSYSVDHIKSDQGSDSSDKTGMDKMNMPFAARFLAGYGDKSTFIINPGTSANFSVSASSLPLVDNSENPLPANTTLQEISKGNYGPILNFKSATMGGQELDESAFNRVVIANPRIYSVDFPCIRENGVVKPQMTKDIVEKKQRADNQIKLRNIDLNDPKSISANYQVINQIYESQGLPPKYDPKGNLLPNFWARFGVMEGITSDKVLGTFNNNQLLAELDDEIQLNSYLQTTGTEDWDSNDSLFERYFGNDYDSLFKGTIWIPIINDYNSAYTNNISTNQSKKLEIANQASNITQSYITPPQI